MKTHPIVPARIAWSDDEGGAPRSEAFGDVYHPRVGAFEQAHHVFLRGNHLPARWRGRARFTIVETGFGFGHNFLAAWQAWRDDPERCERLHFVSVEAHPPARPDLERAHALSGAPATLAAELRARWPPATPNLHAIEFEQGRLRLLLAYGDVRAQLGALRCAADAFFLDGFAPALNPGMWSPGVMQALARLAAPDATAATWSVARALRDGLVGAGFEVEGAPGVGDKREITRARFAPRYVARRPPTPALPAARSALVVGAGIAGACVAHALAREGVEQVTVLDRHPAPAAEASGNPAALVHGSPPGADDGPHARLLRAGALFAARTYGELFRAAGVPGALNGLLWLDRRDGAGPAMRRLLQASGLPPAYVDVLDAPAAARLAGIAHGAPGWWFPDGGWIAPVPAVQALIGGAPGVRGLGTAAVARLERMDGQGGADGARPRWRALDADGRVLGEAALLVLANAAGAASLLQPLGQAPWPAHVVRGQVSVLQAPRPTPLALALTGDGYALPLPDGRLLCGATRVPGAAALELRDEEHAFNAERARRLTGLDLPTDPTAWSGRAAWRLQAGDRLPIAGAVPAALLGAGGGAIGRPPASPPGLATQARWLAREPGLFVLTALGSRGFTLAPLLGALVAAMACGSPWPLEQDLADAIDPGRWRVRAARRGRAPTPAD